MIRYYLIAIAVLASLFFSCERDDICAESTPTTPLLIIRFYDFEEPTALKAVTNLAVLEVGSSDGILFNADSIAIPLRTDEDLTRFAFVLNATADSTEVENVRNEDRIDFTYERTEDYVNKACGFRVTYENLIELRADQNDGFWIRDLIIDQPTIDNETRAHLRIFH